MVIGSIEAGQIELIPIAFVVGDVIEKSAEEFALKCLAFLDTHILTPIQEETQKTFDEIFIKPVEKAIRREYFEQGFYEYYEPNNDDDRLEFFMKEYLNFNEAISPQERYAKNDIVSFYQAYTQVASDVAAHNVMQSKSQPSDIVTQYKKALSQIRQDFNHYVPIQVSIKRHTQEEVFYIRKHNPTLAKQQSLKSNPPHTTQADSETLDSEPSESAPLDSKTPNPKPSHFSESTHPFSTPESIKRLAI